MKKIAALAAGCILLTVAAHLPADTTTLTGFTDTYLVMNRDSTPETQPLLIVEGYHCSACIDQRVLMKFDLAKFTTDALIDKAELKLYSPSQPRPGAAIVRVYRMKKSWNGAEANWSNATKSVKWLAQGGDFEVTPQASLSYGNQVNVWHTYDITRIIQGFVADPASDFGIMLMMEPAMKTVAYVSSDGPKTELRPKLLIDFTPGSAVAGTRQAFKLGPADFRIVNSHIRFSFSDARLHRVQIMMLNGAVFFSGTVIGAQPALPLDGISPGIYFIRAVSQAENMERMFSITRP